MKTTPSLPAFRHLAFVSTALCLLAVSAPARAAIIADFSGGNGTASPDQFKGTAGGGWADAWNSRNGSGGTSTFSVQNTNPLAGGDNYLELDYSRTTAGGSNRAGVARPFQTSGAGSVDVTQPYTIAFDFRADQLTGWSSSGDQLAFSSESSTTIGSFGVDAPWSLLIRADTGWIVTNGNGTGGVTNLNFSSLGLTELGLDTVYSVKVYIDPANNGYDLTVTTGTNTYRASDLNGNQLLGFRTNATAASANVLQFRNTIDGVGDRVAWSLDNVQVVPEPRGLALLAGGAVCLAFGLRHARRPSR